MRRVLRAPGKALLDVAARDCGGRGPMQIQLREGAVLRWAASRSNQSRDTLIHTCQLF